MVRSSKYIRSGKAAYRVNSKSLQLMVFCSYRVCGYIRETMDSFVLEKRIWTEEDFEIMGWHDATIHATKLDTDLKLDIDYIFQWNKPEVEGFMYTFYIAPCILTFKAVRNLTFELDHSLGSLFEISDINREEDEEEPLWTIETQHGYISFNSLSYTQLVRQDPTLQFGQTISYDERGGIGFDTVRDLFLAKNVDEKVQERRKNELEQYQWAKERHVLVHDFEVLQQKRKDEEIDLKVYLGSKRELSDKIAYYDMLLRGTRFDPST